MSIASLPMYDLPELHEANDTFWADIAERMPGAPRNLTRGRDLQDIWGDPDLFLAQTCGYPLVTSLKNRVTLLATPIYTAPGCDGPYYRSAIIVRANHPATQLSDLRGQRCALNDTASNSGMNVFRATIAPLAGGKPFFSAVIPTGAHAASALAVANNDADTAAIDCVTWAHLQRLRPALTRQLRVLDWTMATPGLPLITARFTDAATCHALVRVLGEALRVRDELLLAGMTILPLQAYHAIKALEQQAIALNYPLLT